MSRPHKHPKSSILWFCLAVPKDLREKIDQTEIKLSLGTTDPDEAQIRHARLAPDSKKLDKSSSATSRISKRKGNSLSSVSM